MELLTVCVCGCALMVVLIMQLRRKQHFPPSPPGLPIIGHLHLLQKPLHRCFHKLSQTYGPIFFIKMGSSPAVVLSSPSWAKEFLHTHDRDFADRPHYEGTKRIFYNNRTMVLMEHGPMWRDLRKLYTVHILSTRRLQMFEKPWLEEMSLSIKLIESQVLLKEGAIVDIKNLAFNTVGNMVSRVMFSKRWFDTSNGLDGGESRFKENVEKAAVLFASPLLGDVIPWLSWLDLKGSRKKMDRVAKEFDTLLEEVLAERIATRRGDSEEEVDLDYLDLLLRTYQNDGRVDSDQIKCILLDLLSGSIETTTTAIEWTLAELLKNPSHMKKLQEELDALIVSEVETLNASRKCVKISQLAELEYLGAVIKESLRFHPPVAFDYRQMCKELDKGSQVGGYYLPKNTRVFINLWAMGRDNTVWGANADKFCPERFLSDDVPDCRGQHWEFLPFGAGRRVCPGMNMALAMVPFVLANLVLMFNWDIPKGVTLDFSEAAAFTAPMANPLVAVPTPRGST